MMNRFAAQVATNDKMKIAKRLRRRAEERRKATREEKKAGKRIEGEEVIVSCKGMEIDTS